MILTRRNVVRGLKQALQFFIGLLCDSADRVPCSDGELKKLQTTNVVLRIQTAIGIAADRSHGAIATLPNPNDVGGKARLIGHDSYGD